MHDEKIIYIYQNWNTDIPSMIGRLYVDIIRGREHYAFEYSNDWLMSSERNAMVLDPDLLFYEGRQYVPTDKTMFGIFADSCPDRWGRMLLKRRESILARKEQRKPRSLTETDYLLGVFDESRMGALRFSTQKGGPFLSNDSELAIPPWVNLRELESASLAFENDESGLSEKWLKQLLAPGSSLGGARPKANVSAIDGSLWIAKFPSKNDEYNSGAWEKVVHDLARLCGMNVPESKLETFSKIGSTFLVKRFDRDGEKRIHFASAMTLLGKSDGASGMEGDSYLDLASFIKSYGANPKEDLKELWKRIVFNMAVSNTDDHLRNHGFLLTKSGWRLSPLYDVNPNIYGENLSLNIDEVESLISFELALSTAKIYGLTLKEANEIIANTKMAVKNNWEKIAEKYHISRDAREYMRPAFLECEK